MVTSLAESGEPRALAFVEALIEESKRKSEEAKRYLALRAAELARPGGELRGIIEDESQPDSRRASAACDFLTQTARDPPDRNERLAWAKAKLNSPPFDQVLGIRRALRTLGILAGEPSQ